jgi:alanine dehydrogenase
MPGAVPHTSTYALSNATLPYTIELARIGWREAVLADDALAEGVNVVDGAVTYGPVADSLGVRCTPLRTFL